MKTKNKRKINNNKSLLRGSPKQSTMAGSCWLSIESQQMITEVLLVLPLYLILFFIWWRFQPLIKAMTDNGDILNDDDFFGDIVDTPKEGIEQHKNWECLKSVIDKGKRHL